MEFWHIYNLIYLSVATDILAGFSGTNFFSHSYLKSNDSSTAQTHTHTEQIHTFQAMTNKYSGKRFFFLLQMFWSNIRVMRNDLKSERWKLKKKDIHSSQYEQHICIHKSF